MNNDRIGLHVRKLEAAAIIFKILLVEISAMEMFTGKLALDCSSSLIAFETKLRYILSFADKKIRFLLTCFFIFVYSVLFQFSALMSETAFSQGFFICTWYLFDVSIWILLLPVIIRLYLGRGTKIFLIIWTHAQWIMPSTLKHFLVKRKFVLWSVAKNQTLLRINHTLVHLFRSPLCKLLS